MSSYLLYYHEDRTHLGLAKDTPASRPTEIRSACERKIQILSETRWPAPSLCGGSVDSRAVFLSAKFFFESRPGTVQVLCEHFRGSTNQYAIPYRRTSAKEKEILLMWCTTIWRTGKQGVAHLQAFLAAVGVGSDMESPQSRKAVPSPSSAHHAAGFGMTINCYSSARVRCTR